MKRPWLVATAFWTFVAALYTAQLLYIARQPGENIPVRMVLAVSLSYYLAWIPLTPPVWRIARDWTPGAMRLPALLGRHLALALTVIVAHTGISVLAAGFVVREYLTAAMFFGQLRGRIASGLLVYGAIAGAGLGLSYYVRWREREVAAAQLEAQLSEARLSSLKAQLHPHFLFNSLHAVASLIRAGDAAGAIRTIGGLSDLLRRVLDADARPLVQLSEEMSFIERYFEIQRVRFGDRLRASIELEPGTETLQVPAMLLQPLVENAFTHGLADRVEAGDITVRARRRGDGRLEISVRDNGEGLPAGWNMTAQSGVGLRTTAARLEQVYAGNYEFGVAARDGGGTVATISVPAGRSAP
jgi:signal transduction histidine kinase